MAPHQIQSLELLTAPYLEMRTLINQELQVNPTIELLDGKGEQLIGDPVEEMTAPSESNDDFAALAAEKDEFLASVMQLDASWNDYLPAAHSRSYSTSDDDEKRQHFFDSLAAGTSLSESLLEQLRTNECDDGTHKIGEMIIGNISEAGYFRGQLPDLAMICNVSLAETEDVLRLIQTFDPPGVAARDLRECLLLQLERQQRQDSLAYQIVDKHLDKLGKNRIPDIARALRVSPISLYSVIDEIKRLQPRPGSALAPSNEQFVRPEVFIHENDENGFAVSTNKDHLPVLRISSRYRKILDDPNTAAEVRDYIKDKIINGNLLIKSLGQRQSTIKRIAEKIVEHQGEFLRHGEEALKPLTMGQIASEIGVHETTVSRAAANKYVQTPQGIFPLKRFFSSGFQTDDGEVLSSVSIRKKIEAIVSEEDSASPISDQGIVQLLGKHGVKVARRTVAKYRESLGIPSSHRRKTYGR